MITLLQGALAQDPRREKQIESEQAEDGLPSMSTGHRKFEGGGTQYRKAILQIEELLASGLRHGHFRCAIVSEVGKNNRRELVVEAGMSHKFIIPLDELPR